MLSCMLPRLAQGAQRTIPFSLVMPRPDGGKHKLDCQCCGTSQRSKLVSLSQRARWAPSQGEKWEFTDEGQPYFLCCVMCHAKRWPEDRRCGNMHDGPGKAHVCVRPLCLTSAPPKRAGIDNCLAELGGSQPQKRSRVQSPAAESGRKVAFGGTDVQVLDEDRMHLGMHSHRHTFLFTLSRTRSARSSARAPDQTANFVELVPSLDHARAPVSTLGRGKDLARTACI